MGSALSSRPSKIRKMRPAPRLAAASAPSAFGVISGCGIWSEPADPHARRATHPVELTVTQPGLSSRPMFKTALT